MKTLFDKFATIKGAKFIGLNNYVSKTSGEIADVVINVNIDVEKAKQKDLETLKSFDVETLEIENKDLAKSVLAEMIERAEKNLSAEISERTNQSQAQTDAYISLGKGLKLNKETMDLHITGFAHSKVVLQKGEYKETNKREKTIIKEAIEKKANLKMLKFRNYKISNVDALQITGSTIQMK